MKFTPLWHPEGDPPPEGKLLGTIEGYPPLLPRRGIKIGTGEYAPPRETRTKTFYYNVKAWTERTSSGSDFHIVCFACDGFWMGRWVPEGGVLKPLLEGGLLRLSGNRLRRCPCNVGAFRYAPYDHRIASTTEVAEALRLDQQMANRRLEPENLDTFNRLNINKGK